MGREIKATRRDITTTIIALIIVPRRDYAKEFRVFS